MIMAAAADGAHHVSNMLPFKIALIGILGIGAQWLAWKLQRPAIVLMAIAGLIFGPLISWLLTLNIPAQLTGTLDLFRLDPIHDFGDLYRPMIGLAVAIILFEGGMTLRFKYLGDARKAVIRMVLLASPIAWLLGTCAAHYIVGLAGYICHGRRSFRCDGSNRDYAAPTASPSEISPRQCAQMGRYCE